MLVATSRPRTGRAWGCHCCCCASSHWSQSTPHTLSCAPCRASEWGAWAQPAFFDAMCRLCARSCGTVQQWALAFIGVQAAEHPLARTHLTRQGGKLPAGAG